MVIAQGARKSASALPPAGSRAARWQMITRTPNLVAYIDTARVDRTTLGVARIWFRVAYAKPTTFGTNTKEQYLVMEAREELDCADRRTKDLELRLEKTDGIWIGIPLPPPAWESIDTHPLNSGVFLFACGVLGTPIPYSPGG